MEVGTPTKGPGKQERSCDVLIIGAGFAGGCLARQLRLEQPDLEIIVVDKKEDFDWWVGESTNEPFDDYATRVLKLGPYLTSRHIPKHGLRFFFDSKEKDLPMEEMSELGRARYQPTLSAFQLDRAAFDKDLVVINRKSGIEVLLGTRVLSRESDAFRFDREKGNVVETTAGPIRCRWLVDAGGRSGPLVSKLDLVAEDTRNTIDSYWGRYSGFRSLDELGGEEWCRRVGFTQRFMSTNHFMYDGYWIWHIPVSGDVLSLGVSYDRTMAPLNIKSADDLTTFLRQHRVLRDILPEGAKALDFMGIKQLSRCSRQFFSEDRWFLTGMSGMFVDPFLSNTSSVLIVSNRFIAALILADKAGDKVRYSRLLKHFNVFMQRIFKSLNNEITKFHRFGSYDAFVAWQSGRNNNFFTNVVPLHTLDYGGYIESVAGHPDDCACTPELSMTEATGTAADAVLGRICDEYIQYLEKSGMYYERNRGHFMEGTSRFSVLERLHAKEQDRRAQHAETHLSYRSSFRYYVVRICEFEKIPFSAAAFDRHFTESWKHGQTLADVVTAIQRDPGVPAEVALESEQDDGTRWTPKGPVNAYEQTHFPWYTQWFGPEGPLLSR